MTTAELIQKYQNESGCIAKDDVAVLAKKASLDDMTVVRGSMSAVLAEFSRDVLRRKTEEVTVASSASSLEDWYEDSKLLLVEYPTGQHPKSTVQLRNVELDDVNGTVYFLTIAAGETVNVTYSAIHELPESEEEQMTIPSSRITAFFYLASRHLADRLAAAHAADVNPGYGESIDYKSVSSAWRNNAREYDKRYREIVGMPEQRRTIPAEVRSSYDHPDHRVFTTDPAEPY